LRCGAEALIFKQVFVNSLSALGGKMFPSHSALKKPRAQTRAKYSQSKGAMMRHKLIRAAIAAKLVWALSPAIWRFGFSGFAGCIPPDSGQL
jgi:hypothetical protein